MMLGVQTQADIGAFRAFVTNNGVHSPETLANISLSQLIHPDSNPAKVLALRDELTRCHAQVQATIRRVFEIAEANQVAKMQIANVLAREFATSLDIEARR